VGKRSVTFIPNGKWVDNVVQRDQAIGLAKRYERLLERVSDGADLHDVDVHHEWQACRRHLAELVGAKPARVLHPTVTRSTADAEWSEPPLPFVPPGDSDFFFAPDGEGYDDRTP